MTTMLPPDRVPLTQLTDHANTAQEVVGSLDNAIYGVDSLEAAQAATKTSFLGDMLNGLKSLGFSAAIVTATMSLVSSFRFIRTIYSGLVDGPGQTMAVDEQAAAIARLFKEHSPVVTQMLAESAGVSGTALFAALAMPLVMCVGVAIAATVLCHLFYLVYRGFVAGASLLALMGSRSVSRQTSFSATRTVHRSGKKAHLKIKREQTEQPAIVLFGAMSTTAIVVALAGMLLAVLSSALVYLHLCYRCFPAMHLQNQNFIEWGRLNVYKCYYWASNITAATSGLGALKQFGTDVVPIIIYVLASVLSDPINVLTYYLGCALVYFFFGLTLVLADYLRGETGADNMVPYDLPIFGPVVTYVMKHKRAAVQLTLFIPIMLLGSFVMYAGVLYLLSIMLPVYTGIWHSTIAYPLALLYRYLSILSNNATKAALAAAADAAQVAADKTLIAH